MWLSVFEASLSHIHACSHKCEHNIAYQVMQCRCSFDPNSTVAVYRLKLIARFGVRAFAICARMGTEPKPYTIQPMLVIQGGHLKRSKLLECDFIDNTAFVTLKKTSRNLCSALGKPVSAKQGSPLTDCDLFGKVKLMRNDKVDELIKRAMVSDDPLSDAMDFNIDSKQRYRLFTECKVPDIIEIELPHFVSAEGKHVGPRQLKVVSTWNKNNCPAIEATGPNMDWLLLACQHEWMPKPVRPKRKQPADDIAMTLSSLPDPLKYEVLPDGVIKIYAYVRPKLSKRWKRHEKKVEFNEDTHEEEKAPLIMAAAAKVLKIYQNHGGTVNDDASEDEGDVGGEGKGDSGEDGDMSDDVEGE